MPPFYSINKYCQKLFFAISTLVISATSLLAQTSVLKAPTAASNNTSTGSLAWGNISNITSSDNSYASCGALLGVLASAQTNYIMASGFGFGLPLDATITGIEARVERSAAGLLIGSSVTDKNVFIVKNGSIVGTNHASGAGWSGSDAVATYGSNNDLWSTAWTPTQINSANFGLAFSAQMNAGLASLFLTTNVDYISLKVYYTTPTLPVGVNSFSVTKEGHATSINWTTSSEQNNAYFEICRSANGKDFQSLKTITAKKIASQYFYLDQTPQKGINYYKVTNVDNDGSRTEIGLKALNFDLNTVTDIAIDFNAAAQQAKIAFPKGTTKLEVFDITGKLLQHLSVAPNQISETISTTALPSSICILKAKGTWGSAAKKLIKF